MGFLRRLADILGLGRDNGNEARDEEDEGEGNGDGRRLADNQPRFQETNLPRKGFSVPVQVVVERNQPGPVLLPCAAADGGIQGLRWYSKRLRIDEDGDVADEFLDEVFTEVLSSTEEHHNAKPIPRLEAKNNSRPVKANLQAVSSDGRFQLCVEHLGKLQWV